METNKDSILLSIKKLLGLTDDYNEFDDDIIMHINTVLANLVQIGVGPKDGYFIEDENAKWNDFLPDINTLHQVKSFVYLKVRLLFDPPSNSVLTDSINRQIAELEWRMYTQKGGY